jgi:hypothetical protein
MDSKVIDIKGISNRYQIKKLIKNPINKIVKRKNRELINIISYDNQISLIKNIKDKTLLENDNLTNIIIENCIKDIKTKCSSYKQQDTIKEILNKDLFIGYDNIINLLDESKLMCNYCKENVYIIYDVVRDSKQWTLDRINNDEGHNKNNVVISCLECNLKRRRTNKDAFMFTKNLKIIREEYKE